MCSLMTNFGPRWVELYIVWSLDTNDGMPLACLSFFHHNNWTTHRAYAYRLEISLRGTHIIEFYWTKSCYLSKDRYRIVFSRTIAKQNFQKSKSAPRAGRNVRIRVHSSIGTSVSCMHSKLSLQCTGSAILDTRHRRILSFSVLPNMLSRMSFRYRRSQLQHRMRLEIDNSSQYSFSTAHHFSHIVETTGFIASLGS